jgi:hypothetical protein
MGPDPPLGRRDDDDDDNDDDDDDADHDLHLHVLPEVLPLDLDGRAVELLRALLRSSEQIFCYLTQGCQMVSFSNQKSHFW